MRAARDNRRPDGVGRAAASTQWTMSLRKRLLWMLAAFAGYAVVAAAAAILGSQLHVGRATEEFQRLTGQSTRIDELELLLAQQSFLLQQLVDGQAQALKPYVAARDEWNSALQQSAAFAPGFAESTSWNELQAAADHLEMDSSTCLQMVADGRRGEAQEFYERRLQSDLLPQLSAHLAQMKAGLADIRNQSARKLANTTFRVLALTVGVAVLAAVLVGVGSALVRRWLIRPISQLQAATNQFRLGNLAYRSDMADHDELGQLGEALNEMAEALAASEGKHRTLFSNLRDAVVICDREGRILEYHDGDTQILGVSEAEHVGRNLLDVWPEWSRAVGDWAGVLRSAVDDGRRLRVHDVPLVSATSGRNGRFADFVAYRVDCGTRRCAAIVVRDSTDRHKLQERLRHAETMEAVGTMAGGLAHDVSNLLSSATGSLTSLANELPDPQQQERIRAGLRACRRAAGLSKRLLHFARGIQGNPQVFRPAEVIQAILASFDASELSDISVERSLDDRLHVRMDQDQFAQIVLNLWRNAREATPPGGRIEVRLQPTQAALPDDDSGERACCLLTVADNGPGMSAEVVSRAFEPFFTTKAPDGARGRGMGLSIVHSAVKNAHGCVRMESQPGTGTAVHVYLPAWESETPRGPGSGEAPGICQP